MQQFEQLGDMVNQVEELGSAEKVSLLTLLVVGKRIAKSRIAGRGRYGSTVLTADLCRRIRHQRLP